MIHPVSHPSTRFHFNQRHIIMMYDSFRNNTFSIITSSQSFSIKNVPKTDTCLCVFLKNSQNQDLNFAVKIIPCRSKANK